MLSQRQGKAELSDCVYKSHKDINHVTECFQKSKTYVEVAEKLNDSLYIKGSQWYSANEHIYGIFNDEVVIL